MEENKEWYVVNTYAGHENRVKESLEKRMVAMGLGDCLDRIVVAEEEEVDYKNGKEVKKIKNLFPGYLFVKMNMTDEAWYVVRNTTGVTGLIGSAGGGGKPYSVPEDEMEAVLQRIGQSEKKVVVDFKVGDRVKILSGPFANVEGTVESMDDAAGSATVLAIMFGRETPTEVEYINLEKAL
jgi:transcription termination/antitermination protein NusG